MLKLNSGGNPNSSSGGFEDFYIESKDRVFRTVLATVGNFHDAEDFTSEAFMRAYKAWDGLQHHSSPAAWVVVTAKNLFLDSRRRANRLQSIHAEIAQVDLASPFEAAHDIETYWEIHRAISRLPERQREVLAMRLLLDLPVSEVANVLGITVGSVGTHLHRALKFVRKVIQETPKEVQQ
jgi:RNA polymerase sigma-70 factor (ECF subfamily)